VEAGQGRRRAKGATRADDKGRVGDDLGDRGRGTRYKYKLDRRDVVWPEAENGNLQQGKLLVRLW
jgi:hypothetical protein